MPIPTEIDQFSDPSWTTLAARLRELPGFEPLVKSASLDLDERAALPSDAFAWSDRRLFPFHTPEHAALSYLYASEKTANTPDYVLDTLLGALEVYGVKIPETVKEAAAPADSNPEDFLLPEVRRWRVVSAETVKLAENALREYAHTLSLEQRAEAACRLIKKAEEFGVLPDISTEKLAGLLLSDIDTVRDWVEVRANVAQETYKAAYEKLAAVLARSEPVSNDRPSLVKLASLLSEMDKQAGLDKMYGRKLPGPMDTVFNTDKRAEATIDLAGKSVSLAKLAALPSHLYEDIFGKEAVDEMSTNGRLDAHKLAMILDTMPADLKRILVKQAYL